MAERLTTEQLNKMTLETLRTDQAVLWPSTPSGRAEMQEHSYVVRRHLDQAVRASFAPMPVRRNG